MLPTSRTALVQVALVVPVILLVLFAGLLGLVGLLCGRERRKYVTSLYRLTLDTVGELMHGPPVVRPTGDPRRRLVR